MNALRSRLAGESGIALTVAVMAVVAVVFFSAVLAGAAVNLSGTSDQDRDHKRAVQAAQAGLNEALHRLNAHANTGLPGLLDLVNLQVHVQCIGLTPATATNNECPAPGSVSVQNTGTAGTGTRYSYRVTPALKDQTCSGNSFVPTTQALLTQLTGLLSNVVSGLLSGPSANQDPLFVYRCITSIGETVAPDGRVLARERVQDKVLTMFGMVANIVGNDDNDGTYDVVVNIATIQRPVRVTQAVGIVGTNGKVQVTNNGRIHTDVSHPSGSSSAVVEESGGDHTGNVITKSPPWYLPPVGVGNSRTVNNNGVTCIGTCTHNTAADRRELTIGPLCVLVCVTGVNVMNTGIHNYCKLTINGGTVPTQVTMLSARIFIDPTGCSQSDAGTLRINGNVLVTALNAVDNYTGIYVKGTPPNGSAGVRIAGGTFTGAVYAPETKIEVVSGTLAKGAFYGKRVEFSGGSTYISLLDDVKINLLGAVQARYTRTRDFTHCTPDPPVAGDEESCTRNGS